MKGQLFAAMVAVSFLLVGQTATAGPRVRHCQASYMVTIANVAGLTSASFSVGDFYGRGECSNFHHPDKCRRRARDRAHACMSAHMGTIATPQTCRQPRSIKDYNVRHLTQYLNGEVCDYLQFHNRQNLGLVRYHVDSYTRGKGGCAKTGLLARNFSVVCNRFVPTVQRPLQRHSRVSRITVANGQTRYVRYTDKCRGSSCWSDVNTYLSATDLRLGRAVKAESADNQYVGCGRKAAQNALRILGISLSQAQVGRYVRAHSIPRSRLKATYPSELRRGLQRAIDLHGTGDFRVERYSGLNQQQILSHLRRGYPVIALVNDGSHWVTVSGARVSLFDPVKTQVDFVVQDNWNTKVWSWDRLSLGFDEKASLWSGISNLFGGTSFKSGTIIVFRKR